MEERWDAELDSPEETQEALKNESKVLGIYRISGKDRYGLEMALKFLETDIRRNSRKGREEIKWPDKDWEPLSDDSEQALIGKIRGACHLDKVGKTEAHFGRDMWNQATKFYYHDGHTVDPVREYFESLPPWDETPRIDNLLEELFGVPFGENTGSREYKIRQWASRYPIIGGIERTYEPGCEVRSFPVLQGEGNIGKSSYLEALCPDREWFGTDLNFADFPKTWQETVLGKLIVEFAELAGVSSKNLGAQKSFLTKTVDEKRLAYGKHPPFMKRMFVFIGTVDKEKFLPYDPAGNVRFVPVVLPPNKVRNGAPGSLVGDVAKWIRERRDQLWAEGLVRYRQGERIKLPEYLLTTAYKSAQRATQKNELFEELWDTLPRQKMTLRKIISKLYGVSEEEVRRMDRKITQPVWERLKKEGWVSRSARNKENGNKPEKMWHPPEELM